MLIPLLAVFLAAPSFADESLSKAFADARGRVPRISQRSVNACYERSEDARADALGLPKSFCLKSVGTYVPSDPGSTLLYGGSGFVDEGSGSRLAHVSGSTRHGGVWGLTVDLFSNHAKDFVCGRLNRAFAAVYFDVDANDVPTDGPVAIYGFLDDATSLCRTPAKAVEFLYSRVP